MTGDEGGERTRTVAEGGHDAAVLASFRIEVVDGPDRGSSFAPEAPRTVVGTHPSADLVLTDPTVSRFHCELESTDRGLRLRDLGSRNGTRIDGTDVVEVFLGRPTELVLGDSRLLVGPSDASIRVPVSTHDRFGALHGRSRAMRAVFDKLDKAARSDATVLLTGETGVGKDLAASAIHAASDRADGPFVVVDCGAVPRDLLESELFGHVRGAFTGAHADRIGAFEAADRGTLFLDEIGELDTSLQPKLLRALESRSVRRIGSNAQLEVDVRIVAATHRSLAAEVNQKRFRSDLYYRLAVLGIELPPLRDRPEDVPLLIERIVASLGMEDHPRAAALLGPDVLARLSSHAWPGNVRELRNHVERFLAFGELDAESAPSERTTTPDISVPYRVARKRWVAELERSYLSRLLAAHGGNVSAAARAAGVDRVHMHRLLSRAGLR